MKVALVTGGTRGIGKAISIALRDAGYKVAANYAGNEEAAEEFTKETGIAAYKWDVSQYEESATGIAKVVAELGPIDVLVNNAGITRDSALHKMTIDQWNKVIDVNLTSCFNMCRETINSMRDRNYGRVINISSVNGQIGQFGQTNYSSAKAGIFGFSKALARENASKGITVNCIAPGYINTEMVAAVDAAILEKIVAKVPVGRLGEAEEVARCVVFLADEKAGFITGETISVNGGLEMD